MLNQAVVADSIDLGWIENPFMLHFQHNQPSLWHLVVAQTQLLVLGSTCWVHPCYSPCSHSPLWLQGPPCHVVLVCDTVVGGVSCRLLIWESVFATPLQCLADSAGASFFPCRPDDMLRSCRQSCHCKSSLLAAPEEHCCELMPVVCFLLCVRALEHFRARVHVCPLPSRRL